MDPGEFLRLRLCSGASAFVLAIIVHTSSANPLILPPDAIDVLETNMVEYSWNSSQYFNHTAGSAKNGTVSDDSDESSGGNSMSVMWYLVSFGGLVTFFLLLSFSEFCCKKTPTVLNAVSNATSASEPPSPPPYELFAPPTYDSLFRDISRDRKRSIRASVFLIPVHDKAELPRESPLEFGEVIRRNPMGDGEVVTPPPPP